MTDSTHITPDYLIVGHISRDVTPDGIRLGGTVSYAAFTAAAFGMRVAILTSTAPDEPLLKALPPGVDVLSIPAEQTTTFENRYNNNARTQYMYHRALTIMPDMVPPAWRQAGLVHLGPIAYEADPSLMDEFSGRPICLTPQGWMRLREPDGRVQAIRWDAAEKVLPRATLTVMSEEDIAHDPGLEAEFAALAPLMIVTRAERGGTIYQNGERREFHVVPISPVDPTGAGDVFATVLHIALNRTGDLDRAIQIAARLAGNSVTRIGFAGAPTPQEVAAAFEVEDESTRSK
jgi:sugar/nucleoside kinase (ribokinase family)